MQDLKARTTPKPGWWTLRKTSALQTELNIDEQQSRFERSVKSQLDKFIRGHRASDDLKDLRKHYRYHRLERQKEKISSRASPVSLPRRPQLLLLPELTVISPPKTRDIAKLQEARKTHRASASMDEQIKWGESRRNNRSEAGTGVVGVSQGNQTGETEDVRLFCKMTV